MIEFKLTAVSKNEIVAGIVIDRGERREDETDDWVEFFRLRIGLIFLTLEISWFNI